MAISTLYQGWGNCFMDDENIKYELQACRLHLSKTYYYTLWPHLISAT